MLRHTANEIPELVRKLGSRRRSTVDAARARLSIIGARAVEDLIATLDGDDDRVRARAMPLLALIQDPRGREPVAAMLLDRSASLRAIAAMCLARLPARATVSALTRLLDRERTHRVRIAAVQALVELYAAGQEEAVGRVLELLADTREPCRIRLAACALLPLLPAAERASLLGRLKQDAQEELRRRAEELGASQGRPAERAAEVIEQLVAELGSDDYGRWNRAVHQLAAWGGPAIPPLLAEMQNRAHDPEFCTRAGMALKAMGPRRGRALAEALDRIDESLPLQVLVEVIGALGEKPLIYRLKDLIDRLDSRPRGPAEANGLDPLQRVRAKAHLELARIGSRVAIESLRESLGDRERLVEIEMLAAVELIGTREEIAVLLRAYRREDDFVRERITRVVRSIMRRERIRRNHRMLQTLSADQREVLAAILPRSAPRRARRAVPAPPADKAS